MAAPDDEPKTPPFTIPWLPARLQADVWRWLSLVALLTANLVPLVGVVVLHWDLRLILLLYWAENGVVGFFAIVKLASVSGWKAFFYVPFFCVHYSLFMAGHLAFLILLFIIVPSMFPRGPELPDVASLLGNALASSLLALLALVVSHGVSFVRYFLAEREFLSTRPEAVMVQPYKRIMILHFTIILGGLLTLIARDAMPALVALVLLKVAVDVRGHVREHRPRERPPSATAPAAPQPAPAGWTK